MAESFKLCPICQAQNHINATLCATCGTTITDVAVWRRPEGDIGSRKQYDFRYGETDLFEATVGDRGRLLSLATVAILLAVCITFAVSIILRATNQEAASGIAATIVATSGRPLLPTVTLGPPSATFTPIPTDTVAPTITPTPRPCIRRVSAGDSLIGIIVRCGHNSLEIMPTVVAINGIVDETTIRIGQEIVVPWPSPTFNPQAPTAPAVDSAALFDDNSRSDALSLLSFDPFAPTPTATLLPGLMWHTVVSGENMIVIALQYQTDAKTLSELNPEIEFALCEFGLQYGGPECIVELSQGQTMRVPAPTPTQTPWPTPSGSETPTPRPTATENTPHIINPPNQAFFGQQDQITLRWIATGALAADEVFRIAVSDIATGLKNTADTRDLFFIIPPQWQATDDQRHTYLWQVSIINVDSGAISQTTETRTLVWRGAGATN